jgi:membrane protein
VGSDGTENAAKEPVEEPAKAAEQGPSEEVPSGQARPRPSLLSVQSPEGFIYRIPIVGFFWALYRQYSRRNGPLLSAGIAYYGIFALGPLVILTLQLSAHFLGNGPPPAPVRLADALQHYAGDEMAGMIAILLTYFTGSRSYTFAFVGLAFLLYAAAKLFVRLQASFNTMWDVTKASSGFSWRSLLSRLLAVGMILVPTALLLVGLILGTAFSWLSNLLGGGGFLVQLAQVVIPLLVTWLALLVIFVVLPDVHLSWKDCWFTSLLVAMAWTIATRLLGMYLAWSGSAKYVGTIGALVALLFWVNIMTIITLVGVRLNKALYLRRGKELRPLRFAALVPEIEGEPTPPLR